MVHQLGNPKEWYLADVFAGAFHVDFIQSIVTSENNGNHLIHQLKEFSTQVKDYANTKDNHPLWLPSWVYYFLRVT